MSFELCKRDANESLHISSKPHPICSDAASHCTICRPRCAASGCLGRFGTRAMTSVPASERALDAGEAGCSM